MTAPRVAVPGEGPAEHLKNALQLIAGTKATYDKWGHHSEIAQSLYADLMAVEYRIQQALQQVEGVGQ